MYENTEVLALKLAYKCKMPYRDTVVKEENGKEKIYDISYGYIPVKLPGHEQQLYMLVVNGFGSNPMMLLTTEPLRMKRTVFYRLLGCYLKRWSIEETIRVLNYARLKNMMTLLLTVFYFIAVKLDTAQKLKIMEGHVLKQAKRIFGIPDFKYYALGDGFSAVFKRLPGKLHSYKPTDMNIVQFTLRGT